MAERTFGEIAGNPPGTGYANRREVAEAGVHRPLQAGICGGPDGAESIVVSGGYVDDLDHGDEIIYTGQGGRDPNTGVQIADQELSRGNLGLARNNLDDIPVRVIRGHHGEPTLSPPTGYRYDGLFRVSDYWQEIGKDGFEIWRFRLVATESYRPSGTQIGQLSTDSRRKARVKTDASRDSSQALDAERRVREIHDHACQVCGLRLLTPAGPYAEVARIRAETAPHYGSSTIENLLCLCPNDAVRLSTGTIYVDQAWMIRQSSDRAALGKLRLHEDHPVGRENVRYHRQHYVAAREE